MNEDSKLEDYIGVKEASDILGVSSNTVRRLADSNKLKCKKIQSTGYRRFKRSEVETFKKNFYVTQKDRHENINLKNEKMKNIKAKSHPSHYLMHKYWGRKPHNVVSDYIKNYTKEGDIVLDPFMGSGIVPIESIKANRIGIGVDINPMSKFIAENTVSSINLKSFEKKALEIINTVERNYSYLYETKCPICGEDVITEIAIWKNGELARIRLKCDLDGTIIKDVDEQDLKKIITIKNTKDQMDKAGVISYPKDKVLQYVKRSGKESLDELFTDRALIILSNLRDLISQCEDEVMKKLLLFTFTSMLANVSNMLPGDLEKGTYKSGWVISKFWTPKVHTERNIFHCFKLRVKAIIKGKSEIENIDDTLINLFVKNSNDLKFIENESVDYIFTDPPYGESIAYLALSQFWNSWLSNDVDYANEIIIDSYRSKDHDDYSARILMSFKEMYRVLKDNHYVSFTFHNRDLKVWKGVIDAAKKSGFTLVDINLQEQAVSSGTQGINKGNTLTGDFVYTLLKNNSKEDKVLQDETSPVNNRKYIEGVIEELVSKNNGISPSKLYEYLIPVIVRTETYLDENGNALDIEKILEENYSYIRIEEENKIGESYQWIKK